MIQRIQTVYLFIAAVLSAVCLVMPVGILVPEEVGVSSDIYNLFILTSDEENKYDFSVCGMFFALAAATLLSLVTIFMYRKRRVQAGMCSMAAVLLLLWYVLYVLNVYTVADDYNAVFALRLSASLPAVSLILELLARRAILKDEALVRAADRIR